MGSLSMWGALATALLALECFGALLGVGVLVFGLNYGMDWVLRQTRNAFAVLNHYLGLTQHYLVLYQSKAAAPFVQARGVWYGAKRALTAWRQE